MDNLPATRTEHIDLLAGLGARIRLARRCRGLSAAHLAAEAGITRVTLTALETRGQSTLSTLSKVLAALGMPGDINLLAKDVCLESFRDGGLALKDLPHLREVAAWHIQDENARLSPIEAFSLYERNWRYLDPKKIVGDEAQILRMLTQTVGKGVLLV